MPMHYDRHRKLADMGRMGDSELAHVTPGEIVIPRNVLAHGDTRGELAEAFAATGAPMGRFVVGGMDDSINPRTGMREYFGPGDDPSLSYGDLSSIDASGSPTPEGFGDDAPDGGGGGGRSGYGVTWGSGNPDTYAYESARRASTNYPSRASTGGGYHGPGGAVSRGYTGMGADLATETPSGPATGTAREGRRSGRVGSVLGAVFGSLFGIPGAGAVGRMFQPYNEEAKALNRERMAAGQPHHDPRTGEWTVPASGEGAFRDFMTGMNPRNWHAGPPGGMPDPDAPTGGELAMVDPQGSGGSEGEKKKYPWEDVEYEPWAPTEWTPPPRPTWT